MDAKKLERLCDILAPLNRSEGKHHATVEIWPGSSSGTLYVDVHWKSSFFEIPFGNFDEAFAKRSGTEIAEAQDCVRIANSPRN